MTQLIHGWKVYLVYACGWCGELLCNMQIEWSWKGMCMATRRLIIPGKQTVPLGWLLYVPLWQVSNLTLVLLSSVTSALSDTFTSIFRGTKYSHTFISQEMSFFFFYRFKFFDTWIWIFILQSWCWVSWSKIVKCLQCLVCLLPHSSTLVVICVVLCIVCV